MVKIGQKYQEVYTNNYAKFELFCLRALSCFQSLVIIKGNNG